MVRSRLPSRRFRDFWRVAREIDHHTGIHQVAAADRRDRSFCFPARIDDSKTVGRAGQSSSPYEIGANSAQAAAPFGRGSDRAHGAHPRAQTTPRAEAHGRSKVARFSGASFPRASVRSSAFTQPSPARRPAVRCGPRKTSRAATGGCGVIRVVRVHGRDAEGIVGRRAAQAGGAHVPPRAQGAPEEQEGHVR